MITQLYEKKKRGNAVPEESFPHRPSSSDKDNTPGSLFGEAQRGGRSNTLANWRDDSPQHVDVQNIKNLEFLFVVAILQRQSSCESKSDDDLDHVGCCDRQEVTKCKAFVPRPKIWAIDVHDGHSLGAHHLLRLTRDDAETCRYFGTHTKSREQ